MGEHGYKRPPVKVPPDSTKNIWCLFCDWHMHDTFSNRRRLGEHIVNDHPEEVLVPQGQKPEPLVDLGK